MSTIQFDGVGKRYGSGAYAVRDLSFTIEDGEFMVVVGPSGCGKSTALRMAAGLEPISEGVLRIGGMTVGENIAFPLASRGVAKDEIARRVATAAKTLGLTDYLGRRPKALSGGQRQRVAMGRAIVRDPQIFLMDEPLSNLDAKLRNQMRAEIIALQKQQGVTTLYVTHDQTEAMTMGHRIAIMRDGLLQQVGTPRELYEKPANVFVAAFVGSPAMNLFRAELRLTDTGPELVTSGETLALGPDAPLPESLRVLAGQQIIVGIRPEDLSFGPAPHPCMRAEVKMTEELPPEMLVHLSVRAETPMMDGGTAADTNFVSDISTLADNHRAPMIARLALDMAVPGGAQIDLRLNPRRLHFFRATDGSALT